MLPAPWKISSTVTVTPILLEPRQKVMLSSASFRFYQRSNAKFIFLQSILTEGEYRFDHLREIDAIQALKGSPIFDLLEVFITGDLEGFEKFMEGSDLSEIALSEEKISILRRKMRLLTLVGLCKANPDTTYKFVLIT